MRKLVVLTFLSLDGVMQSPGGPEEDTSDNFKYGGWSFPYWDSDLNDAMDKQMGMPFDLLLGRKTYDVFAAHWPKYEDESGGLPLNKATKYVVSRSTPDLSWKQSILISGNDVVEQIEELKQQDGPMLQVHGSGELIQTLLKHDLVDELWLKTYPVILGPGKKLFAQGAAPAAFELIDSNVSSSGVVIASYKRAGNITVGSFSD